MAVDARSGGAGGLTAALDAARLGDDEAFRVVYRTVQPALLRYVRGLVGDDADDVTSEAWLQIARGLATFSGDADGFRAWAATIARNRAMDHLRQQRRRPIQNVPDEVFDGLSGVQDTETQAIAAVGAQRALAMIALLPPDQAEAVLLRVVMGLDANGAARVLGKRAGAVRTASYRGLRSLAKLLDQRGIGRDLDTGLPSGSASERATQV